MRAQEFISETASAGATAAGSIATVAAGFATIIRRTNTKPAKYANSLTPATKKKSQK